MTEDRVVVTDINMPFWSMVVLMIKLGIAAIPAIIILAVVYGILSIFLDLLSAL